MLTYLKNVLVSLDVFLATLFGFSAADITISTCCDIALVRKTGLFEQLLGIGLNKLSPGHTAAARAGDIARAQAAIAKLS